jgi:hypothetical protein
MDLPLAPFSYTMSCMHCMTVSLADGGMGLGAMWGEQQAQEMLTDAGFTSIETADHPAAGQPLVQHLPQVLAQWPDHRRWLLALARDEDLQRRIQDRVPRCPAPTGGLILAVTF